MFDVILYPVSAVLKFWHTAFGTFLDPAGGPAWALAIFFLVFTVRALLIKPAINQLRSARRASVLAPRVARLREKYRNDPQRLVAETRKLYADNGTSMFGGFLPMLLQIPVFFGLYGVLRGFTPDAAGNQIFDRQDVLSFCGADLFGARLSNWIREPATQLAQLGADRADVLVVGLTLMLLAGAATFFSMRLSARRQAVAVPDGAGPPVPLRVMTWLAPCGIVVSGLLFALPIGLLLYFLATNLWTLGQTHVLGLIVERDHRAAPGRQGQQT